MIKIISIVAALAALAVSSAHAESAFGIEYGGELPAGAVDVDDGYFTVSTPPKPHSLFELYVLKHTAETGVCNIAAISQTFENDKYGTKAKKAYDKLVKALDGKYGPEGDTWEALKADALWSEADEFAMSLVKGDREHSRWFEPNPDSQNGFDYVQILIKATDSSSTYIRLDYRNRVLAEKCTAVLSSEDNDSL